MPQPHSLVEPAAAPTGTVVVDRRCSVHAEGRHRVVVIAGLPVHDHSVLDAVAETYAMLLLLDGGHATQVEVARALAPGCAADRAAVRFPVQLDAPCPDADGPGGRARRSLRDPGPDLA